MVHKNEKMGNEREREKQNIKKQQQQKAREESHKESNNPCQTSSPQEKNPDPTKQKFRVLFLQARFQYF